MEITVGRQRPRGVRAVIYGVEGIGKTTLASKLEKPLFLDLEKGSFGLDTSRIDCAGESYQGILGIIASLKADRRGFKTLVVDSADRLEEAIVRDYLKEKGVSTLVGYGKYGDGWIETAERFCTVLDRLGDLADAGMNVAVIGHAQQRRVELPEQTDSYDHWELNLSRRAAPKCREWPEILAFVNYKMAVVPSQRDFGKTVNKAEGGRRMVYASHTPYWDAKHRAGIDMPDSFPLDDAPEIFRRAMDPGPRAGEPPARAAEAAEAPEREAPRQAPKQEAPRHEAPVAAPPPAEKPPLWYLREAMSLHGIGDDELRGYIRDKGICGRNEPWPVDGIPPKVAEWLLAKFDAVAEKIKAKRGAK